jgi:hypothetical protein
MSYIAATRNYTGIQFEAVRKILDASSKAGLEASAVRQCGFVRRFGGVGSG